MASLADLEALLERIFERSTARLLRARLTAVQLERRVERSMELARRPVEGRVLVPSAYRVSLHPRDLASVAAGDGDAERLAGRLADAVLLAARRHAYLLAGRPTVSIVVDPALVPGEVVIEPVPDAPPDGVGPPRPAGHQDAPPDDPASGSGTIAFHRPAPSAPRARLRIVVPGTRERSVIVDGTPLTIGRAPDNVLVLADPGVSRHHGRLQGRSGLLVYRDLGSTNGSTVNGVAIDEVVLGPGDRIALGATTLIVDPEEG
jgi:hypothetical protein